MCVYAVVGCADSLTAGGSAATLRARRLTATVRCLQTGLIHHAVCIDHRSLGNVAKTCTAAAASRTVGDGQHDRSVLSQLSASAGVCTDEEMTAAPAI